MTNAPGITYAPTTNGARVMRVRFEVDIEEVKNDYRPIPWPIPHPYWCSGETSDSFILVAYVENQEQLLAQWPEAKNIDIFEQDLDQYTFTTRFIKPDWF